MTHAQKRLQQRFGIKPGKGLVKKIAVWIQNDSPRAAFVRPSYRGTAIYRIQLGKQSIPVVFSRRFNNVVTVLPKGAE